MRRKYVDEFKAYMLTSFDLTSLNQKDIQVVMEALRPFWSKNMYDSRLIDALFQCMMDQGSKVKVQLL